MLQSRSALWKSQAREAVGFAIADPDGAVGVLGELGDHVELQPVAGGETGPLILGETSQAAAARHPDVAGAGGDRGEEDFVGPRVGRLHLFETNGAGCANGVRSGG